MLLRVLDPLVVALVGRRVGALLRRDLREAGPARRRIPAVELNAARGIERPQLDELVRGNVERAEQRTVAGELDVAPDVDRMAPRAHDLARRASASR